MVSENNLTDAEMDKKILEMIHIWRGHTDCAGILIAVKGIKTGNSTMSDKEMFRFFGQLCSDVETAAKIDGDIVPIFGNPPPDNVAFVGEKYALKWVKLDEVLTEERKRNQEGRP